ncbi:MAG: beta-ketoacyl-[acyl-carrier-protein] synthase II [Chloroflexi bacterium]|nr:beta-ketoacyl-[acyl-carrier-protein] synthase II [Chloroflexota bacterium]|tara:strand:- start:31060 stop:32307 length:1248 start_codon:yes stop_codon:yes gene_type:complete
MSHKNRVVVTGLGVMSPLGESVNEFWDSLISGKSGIGKITLCDTDEFPNDIAGEVTGFDPGQYIDPKEAKRMARFSQMAVAAAAVAIEDSKINISDEDPWRLGVLIGNGNGGFPTTQDNADVLFKRGAMKMSPFFVPMILPNMAAANVSRVFGLKGYTNTVITACAAGNQAIGEAAEVIRRGTADVIVAGGCEAGISRLGLGGFHVIRALSRYKGDPSKASRPFDLERDGFVPGEGAGILILESLDHALKRGANIFAEIVGYGISSDAYHAVQPDETGEGASKAIELALKDAGIGVDEVDYINAHGTSTPLNDASETKAIKKVFNEHSYKVPISSTKSMTGHILGGAGAIEGVASVKTIESNIIHPTINLRNRDENCDLDYVPNTSRATTVNKVLSNNFGFGGQNACVIYSSFEE